MKLCNKYSRIELRAKVKQSKEARTVFSFYRYMHIAEPENFRDELYLQLDKLNVLGRIYVAQEGINAQISIADENTEKLRSILPAIHPELQEAFLNAAVESTPDAFILLKIKVRNKIVADGIDDPFFDPNDRGFYLTAEKFNDLSQQKNTLVVDMRNHYEYEVGHFKNAITYSSDTFREQVTGTLDMLKNDQDKNILLYCTGGIRCEKFSAYMKHQGFKNVFHLRGGIINYAKQVKEQNLENKFLGKNFVFDERLGERISEEIIAECHQCGKPCDNHTNCANEGCHLLFIQCDACKQKFENCCSTECKEIHALPKELCKAKRKGITNGQNIFNKSRAALTEKFHKH